MFGLVKKRKDEKKKRTNEKGFLWLFSDGENVLKSREIFFWNVEKQNGTEEEEEEEEEENKLSAEKIGKK